MLLRATLCLCIAGCRAGAGGSDPDPDLDPGDDGGTTDTPSDEVCDGLDNDQNGSVDEGCACGEGATQACWPGAPSARNRGVCSDGQQTCQMGTEFGGWGSCEGAVLPSAEIEGNCVDEDCNGEMPGCTDPCAEFEVCGNAMDDDCDGLIDCQDDGCDCPTDCNASPELCTCTEQCRPGTERFCDEPEFCAWGLQQCGPDGRWGACIETTDRIPAGCEEEENPFGFPIPSTYDPECCVNAGQCCQNFGYDPSQPSDASVGSCAGIVDRVCMPI